MENNQIRQLIRQELPLVLRQDREFREWVRSLMQEQYADKVDMESRFDRLLDELRRDREENTRKWEANQQELRAMREEQERKWEEQNRKWEANQQELRAMREEQERKWEEQNRKWEANQQELRAMREEQERKWEENTARLDRILDTIEAQARKHDQGIGALGARWGMQAEQSFRNGLKGILERSFGVEVLNITEYDDAGEVFGHPDQVELDLIILNGTLILCEIKSSMSKSDMYAFERKVAYYEKHHGRKADRKLVISPMVDPKAQEIAQKLGIEVYSYADSVKL
ncbi:MAG TPA: DUF3782 domain-containing protein [Anaerolineae bacterium]|nr:DUF3782 domain-containing protein [Anaerolineae bacterium]